MLLNEQEIALWLHIADEPISYARAIESAVLAKLKAQEPMCWMTPSGEGWMMRTEPPTIDTKLGWTALYEHPLPPDDVMRDPRVAELEAVLRECREELDRLSTCENGMQYRRVAAAIAKIDEVLK